MRAAAAVAYAGPILSVWCAACFTSTSEPRSTEASLTTGEYLALTLPGQWVSCSDPFGCQFRGEGFNEGPACASNIQGIVRFVDAEGRQILDREGRQIGTTFSWQVDPKPGATIRPGQSFTYLTVGFVPPGVSTAAERYLSSVTIADVRNC